VPDPAGGKGAAEPLEGGKDMGAAKVEAADGGGGGVEVEASAYAAAGSVRGRLEAGSSARTAA
jgi:hypothetical protein